MLDLRFFDTPLTGDNMTECDHDFELIAIAYELNGEKIVKCKKCHISKNIYHNDILYDKINN